MDGTGTVRVRWRVNKVRSGISDSYQGTFRYTGPYPGDVPAVPRETLLYTTLQPKCGIQYVGQTKNHIIDRFQGHFNDISSGRDTTVASHFNTCTPSDSDKLSNIETTVLDFIKANPHSLTAGKQSDSKEKHWIHQLHTVVPRGLNSGHNLPDKSCVADTAMQIELA